MQMHITWESVVIGLLSHFTGLSSYSLAGKSIDKDYEVSIDLGPGDELDEITVVFGSPSQEQFGTLSKIKRITPKKKCELKRSKKSTNMSVDVDYDYDELRREYYGEIYDMEKEGVAYNYSEHRKMEETVGDSIHSIADFHDPVNCSQEEYQNIGIQAIHCLWQDYSHEKSPGVKNRLLRRTTVLLFIWIAVYMLIVIPLWCTKGWCCCCCPCRLCHPRQVVLSAKKFMYENKPGEITHPNGEVEYYDPTNYEKEAYRRLQHLIKNF